MQLKPPCADEMGRGDIDRDLEQQRPRLTTVDCSTTLSTSSRSLPASYGSAPSGSFLVWPQRPPKSVRPQAPSASDAAHALRSSSAPLHRLNSLSVPRSRPLPGPRHQYPPARSLRHRHDAMLPPPSAQSPTSRHTRLVPKSRRS
ncbi:hypothetical protein EJ06DRAFT_34041 [Trichodelitschia bisporula]|uniref:Uncharacterized protein n=1 Tax=Trichodelitschia bisporula TaxID=703511 RepID=A0A6G1HUM3_9PEZI|nr:hypothetical protein EJ06DRAFT_34041 [Trichodelitschia bisporula]